MTAHDLFSMIVARRAKGPATIKIDGMQTEIRCKWCHRPEYTWWCWKYTTSTKGKFLLCFCPLVCQSIKGDHDRALQTLLPHLLLTKLALPWRKRSQPDLVSKMCCSFSRLFSACYSCLAVCTVGNGHKIWKNSPKSTMTRPDWPLRNITTERWPSRLTTATRLFVPY